MFNCKQYYLRKFIILDMRHFCDRLCLFLSILATAGRNIDLSNHR